MKPDIQPAPAKSRISLLQFTWTFVPFALLVAVALLYPELSQNLRLFRTIYLIRASLLLAVPALVLFPYLRFGPAARNLWRLFWTFGLIAHLAHLVYAVWFVFGAQLETAKLHPSLYGLMPYQVSIYGLMVEQQTAPVVWANFAVTIIWLVDVGFAWIPPRNARKTWLFHAFAWLSVVLAFLGSTIYFYKNRVSYNLGIGLIAAIAISLAVRLFWHPKSARTLAEQGPP